MAVYVWSSSPIAVIMGFGMWWLPASPRWLLLCAIQRKGDAQHLKDTAICSLCQLQGRTFHDSAPQQVVEIMAELSYIGVENEVTFVEMFRGKCKKALVISAGLVLFQQITGQPSVLYYAASSFINYCNPLFLSLISIKTTHPRLNLSSATSPIRHHYNPPSSSNSIFEP
ncbi:hypothetical protein RYX36_026338 [Vicia faba]